MLSTRFVCLLLIGFVSRAQASGEYIPKAVYLIDEDGYETEPIFIRNKREIEDVLSRIKRGGGAYSYSGSSSSSGGDYGSPSELAQIQAQVEDIVKHASTIPNQIYSRFADTSDSHPLGSGNGAGGTSYSYSGSTGSGFGSGYSSGSSGNSGSGGYSGNGGSTGHTGSRGYSGQHGSTGTGGSSGHFGNGGYSNNGGSTGHSGNRGSSSEPNIFSRSGVEKGTGIKVSSAAQGPNAAFSSSSSSSDGQGNVKYDVKSGKY